VPGLPAICSTQAAGCSLIWPHLHQYDRWRTRVIAVFDGQNTLCDLPDGICVSADKGEQLVGSEAGQLSQKMIT
jgi:hypothetical protein